MEKSIKKKSNPIDSLKNPKSQLLLYYVPAAAHSLQLLDIDYPQVNNFNKIQSQVASVFRFLLKQAIFVLRNDGSRKKSQSYRQ